MNASLASIAVRPTELGGRHLAISSGYVGDMLLADRRLPVVVQWIGRGEAAPGTVGLAILLPRDDVHVELATGDELALLEGVREVAGGSILAAIPSGILGELRVPPPAVDVAAQGELVEHVAVGATNPDAHDLVIKGGAVEGLVVDGPRAGRVRVGAGHVRGARFSDIEAGFSVSGSRDQTIFEGCLFSGVAFEGLVNARFERCVIADSRFGQRLGFAEFIDCRFEGSLLTLGFDRSVAAPVLVGRDLGEFHGNDFSRAELLRSAFRGIDFDGQLWPADHRFARLRMPGGAVEATSDALTGSSIDLVTRLHLRWFGDFYGQQSECTAWIDDRDPVSTMWRTLGAGRSG